MKEDLEELFTQEEEKPLKKFLKKGWIIGFVLALGIYVYFLFYGDNSIMVYSKLVKEKRQIENQVLSLQNENVELQKVIFELRGLEPNLEEKK
ncbi:septum formation initiator family protein [Helicobacter brantae]|uniref:Septum formation initiator n=1 Tax=Helicobacter brantae TaxID=375927 RepID=A0A3D8IYL2_9HELI|nr:hypothetical protein [Helicobacter brantae]RDU70357.1 hypothetical protein CQA58_05860 [Helicobacter brantae]